MAPPPSDETGGPFRHQGARAVLILSTTMTVLGLVGVFAGYTGIQPAPERAHVQTVDVDPEVAEANEDLLTALLRSPIRQGLSVANLLVSALLVIGSFLLTARRRSALWWTRQALLANILYSLAEIPARIALTVELSPALRRLALLAQTDPPPGAPVDALATGTIWAWGGGQAFLSLLFCGLYIFLLRFSRRAEVESFVMRAPRPEP